MGFLTSIPVSQLHCGFRVKSWLGGGQTGMHIRGMSRPYPCLALIEQSWSNKWKRQPHAQTWRLVRGSWRYLFSTTIAELLFMLSNMTFPVITLASANSGHSKSNVVQTQLQLWNADSYNNCWIQSVWATQNASSLAAAYKHRSKAESCCFHLHTFGSHGFMA